MKQDIYSLKGSNKDLVKLLTGSSSNITTPLLAEVVKRQNKENKTLQDMANKQKNKEKEKPVTNIRKLYTKNSVSNNESITIDQVSQMPTIQNNLTDEYLEVLKQKPKRKKQMRNAETQVNNNLDYNPCNEFEGRQEPTKTKKIWICITKAKYTVTEDSKNRHYKKATTKEDEISVKQIKTYYQIKDNNCFLVGVDPSLIKAVYDANFWPRGVGFDRFNFYKGKHFLDNTQKESHNAHRISNDFLIPN